MPAHLPVSCNSGSQNLMTPHALLIAEDTLYRVRWTEVLSIIHTVRNVIAIGRKCPQKPTVLTRPGRSSLRCTHVLGAKTREVNLSIIIWLAWHTIYFVRHPVGNDFYCIHIIIKPTVEGAYETQACN